MSNRRIPFGLALFALLATLAWTACGGSSGPTCAPTAEVCNGLDDDCDGQVDEGFDLGVACTVGVGACQASGVKVCASSGAGAVCSAAPGAPTAETCNQLDDDCDGQVDQGLSGCCVPATTRACGVDVGACRAGVETCGGTGAWGACLLDGQPVLLPGDQAEICNGVDDDCDGQTDEADAGGCTTFYVDQDQDGFGAGPGACLCAPAAPYTASAAGDCDDAVASVRPGAAETCNGRDDDCDGQVDEGFDVGAACSAGAGACSMSGVLACAAGGASATCTAVPGTPSAESCNGVDDDCDGLVDEEGATGCTMFYADLDRDGHGAGTGACLCAAAPPYTTPATGGLDCDDANAAIHPGATEACNGVDDDCDGQTDEGFLLGTACSAGTGACLRTAFTVCTVDGTGATCGAVPGTPSPEVCNGVDDNCDGRTDEDVPEVGMACDGADGDQCKEGTLYCQGAAGLVCGDATATNVELCNGVDDDCDGQTDEGFLLGTACTAGTGACLRTAFTVCKVDGTGTTCGAVPGTPTPEVCNGVDDDCDGQTDEALTGPYCENQMGVCAGATKPGDLCVSGAWLACTQASYSAYSAAYQPVEVACADGLDNDCDGLTDTADPNCP